jgi:PHP domain
LGVTLFRLEKKNETRPGCTFPLFVTWLKKPSNKRAPLPSLTQRTVHRKFNKICITSFQKTEMLLNCHSYHSLRYGTIPLENLVLQAKTCNATTLALTDINTITGIYDFTKLCLAENIKPIVGVEFRQNNKLLFIGLAKNKEGIAEMCQLLTNHNLNNTSLPLFAPNFQHVYVIYPSENQPSQFRDFEFLGIRPDEISKLFKPEWKSKIPKSII